MGILSMLASFALRGVVGEGAVSAVNAVSDRLTDQGKLLTDALQRAGERAWKAVELALAGEGLLNKLDDAGTNSSLAISNGQIFLRTFKHLWCIAKPQ